MENPKRHLRQIESLRALAALSVVIFHFSAYYFYLWEDSTQQILTYGAQGVEVFYLISGFIIPYSLYHSSYRIKSYFKYMGKRLIRLLPPYFATIVLIQIVGWMLQRFIWGGVHQMDMNQIFVNLFFLADLFPQYDWINPIFATLEVELQFYLIIGLLFPLMVKEKWFFTTICLVLLVGGILTRDMDTVLINSPYFIGGMSLFFLKTKGFKIEYFIPLVAALIFLFQFFQYEDIAALVLGGLLIFFLPAHFKFLNFTGRISYSLYLIHGLAGGNFIYFVQPTDFGQAYPILVIGLAILFSWCTAFILYFVTEWPALKISKLIRYRK
ncbi:MAG: acyltransferase [Crocinitomicaceae bacterium]